MALHRTPEPTVATTPGDPLAPFRSERAPITVALSLDAPESGALLRQIGLTTPPTTAVGRGRINATVRVGASNTMDGSLTATLGDTVIGFKGSGDLRGEGEGHASLRGQNVAPLLRGIALANPEVGATWTADAEADVTLRDGHLGTRGLTGRLLGSRISGDLGLVLPSASGGGTPPGSNGASGPAALTGSLTIDRLPLPLLTGLALGPLPQPKPGAFWSDAPFAAGSLNLPRAEVALDVANFQLNDTMAAREARMTLRLAPGLVTLADLSAGIGDGGRVGGTLTLRRNGGAASLSGHIEWSGLPLATPSLAGRSRAALDVAGTGASAAGLIAGLAGSGTFGIDDARLPRFDPDAIGRVAASTEGATDTLDPTMIAQTIDHELDRAALTLGPVNASVTIASGVLRSDPVRIEGPTVSSETTGSLDLRALLLSLRSTATLKALPKGWTGRAPQVSIEWKGPVQAPSRRIDAAELVNGIAARAIARDQARIDAFQDDVRERAFFARRLKAIEAEQAAKAEVDRQKALLSSPATVDAVPRPPARPERPLLEFRPSPAR